MQKKATNYSLATKPKRDFWPKLALEITSLSY